MSNWSITVDLTDIFKKSAARDGDLQPFQLASEVASRLRAEVLPKLIRDWEREEFEGIIEEFEGLSSDDSSTFEDFDWVYGELCDWGDERHRLWVQVF